MKTHSEHAKAPAAIRIIEMVGVSTENWHDAVDHVVARASETLRHVTGVDVERSTAVVRDGKITEYHVACKVAFVVEPADIEKA